MTEPPAAGSPPSLSVVVPLCDEAEVLPELLRRLDEVLEGLEGGPHQIVLVDDGSQDGTRATIRRAAEEDDRIRGVFLSRNFGHQAAITAGLDHVDGDATIVMDGDLQDPPEAIPRLVEKHREGYDVVYARRTGRKEAWWLRLAYRSFYRIMARLSTLPLPLDAGDFSLMSRRVVKELRGMPERNRYVRGLRTWAGFSQCGIAVERGERGAGEPKYGVKRLFKLALDGIFSFSMVPLRLATVVGAVTLAITGTYAVYALIARLWFGRSPQGFTALIVTIVFMSGVQLLFLGVLGEYLGRIYRETKRRPHYVVEELTGEHRPPGTK